jgi:hypothetical protein
LGSPAAAAQAAAEATWGHDAYGGPYHASLLTYNASFAIGESGSEHIAQCGLLRDIIGPFPFRPAAIDPVWLRWNFGTIPAIARHIYEERAFHDMPILADALEDAGCVEAAILGHCRGPRPHVRGCWVLDLLLGKE